jgi:hypothetical protein
LALSRNLRRGAIGALPVAADAAICCTNAARAHPALCENNSLIEDRGAP